MQSCATIAPKDPSFLFSHSRVEISENDQLPFGRLKTLSYMKSFPVKENVG